MWRPVRLVIKDFMSIEHADIEIQNGLATLIYGQNDYDEDQESNGSGKSAILEAISIALLNEPLRDCTASDLVRDFTDEFFIGLELHNTRFNRTMEIQRITYTNSKQSECKVFVDGDEHKKLTGVRDANKFILDEIGITAKDLTNYYLINKEKYIPFLKMRDSHKKEMIGRFSQANLIEPIFSEIDAEIDRLQIDIDHQEKEIIRVEAIRDTLKQQLLGHDPKKLQEQRDKIVQDYVEQAEKLSDQCSVIEAEIEDYEKDVKTLNSELEKVPDLSKLRDKIKQVKGEINESSEVVDEIREDIDRTNDVLAKIKKNLAGTVGCPKCKHEFVVGNPDVDVAKQRIKKSKADKILNEYQGELQQEKDHINKLKVKKSDLTSKLDKAEREVDSMRDRLRSLERTIKNKKQALKDNNEEISNIEVKIDLCLENSDNDSTAKFNEEIAAKEKELEEISVKIESLTNEQNNLKEQRVLFTQFKTHLSNKAIGSLEVHANDYLQKTGSQLEIQLDGYKVTKTTKKVREKITATILRNGNDSLFGRMSSGEKARIEIALIIAPQTLINSTCESGGLDLLFMDEIVESVDSKGIGGILKSLNVIERTIFVVTHATYNQPYPHTLTVHKQSNGIAVMEYG